MTSQIDKGINSIAYNYLDLPEEIKFNSTYIVRNKVTGDEEIRNVRTNYIYRADGTKLRKEYTFFFNKGGGSERTATTDYLDGFQYTVDHLGKVTLEFVPTSEGYYDFKNKRYIYNYTDHLGNTRLSYFKNAGGSAEVLEENNYYPFGLKHEGYNGLAGNPSYQYNYNGKELQEETGMLDYGWRQYMPEIGRWNGIDQLAENYISTSTYAYVANNPVLRFDVDGRWFNEDGTIDKSGHTPWFRYWQAIL
jgi:RHS repeat-associated protein